MRVSRCDTCSGGVTSGPASRSSSCRPGRSPRRRTRRLDSQRGLRAGASRLTSESTICTTASAGPAGCTTGSPSATSVSMSTSVTGSNDAPRTSGPRCLLPLAGCRVRSIHPRGRARPAAFHFSRDARRRGRPRQPSTPTASPPATSSRSSSTGVERLARVDARRDRARRSGRRRAARPIHSHHRRRRVRERLHAPVPAAARLSHARRGRGRRRIDETGTGPGGSKHITWDQAREMQESGLVEFASHGYALHTAISGQPAGKPAPGLRVPGLRPGKWIRTGRRIPRTHHAGPAAFGRAHDARARARAACAGLALRPLHATVDRVGR